MAGFSGSSPAWRTWSSGTSVAAAAPDRVGERRGDVLREAQRLADLADRHARAVVDHRGADRGAVAAVALVDVLDHLLAPLVLEIDVDVGRLAALLGDEAGEERVALGRIDRGDAEAEADGAVGGRAAALAEDVLVPGEVDDVVDGQEVAGVVELLDERELLADQGLDLRRERRRRSASSRRLQVRSSRCCCGVLPGGTGSSGYS